mgnify:CR=1 FL=1
MPEAGGQQAGLAGLAFFESLPPELCRRADALVYRRDYDARQVVYFPDDPCDFAYWVEEGRVRVTRVGPDSRELSFRHAVPGTLFGEDMLAGRARREDYAECLVPTRLVLVRADDFMRLCHGEPAFAVAVARSVCQRAIEAEHVLAEAVFHSVRRRVAAGLVRLCAREATAPPHELRVTHQEVANLCGTTRETTTLVLQDRKSVV